MTSRIEFITRGVKIMARPNSASAKRAAANRERAKKRRTGFSIYK